MHAELRRMASELRQLAIESSFARMHHFSSNLFATNPPTLDRFVAYCEGVGDLQDGENPQTIRRALALAQKVKGGSSLEDAIAAAWRSFPLTTR